MVEAGSQGDLQANIFRSHPDQDRLQPYMPDLRDYLTALNARITPQGPENAEIHRNLEAVARKAAVYLKSSDKAAQITSRQDYLSVIRRQKSERGSCAIGLFICIDGRLMPVIIAGPAINTAEAKAGLIPTTESPLDGVPEIASTRIAEATIDRPLKENSQLLQISVYHGDLLRGNSFVSTASRGDINCAAIEQLIQRGQLPAENPIASFRKMLDKAGDAVGTHYNNSARLMGKNTLKNVALTAFYDTRTAGFVFGDDENHIFTTDITKAIIHSEDFDLLKNIAQPDTYRTRFTEAENLTSRENVMIDIQRALMTKGRLFDGIVSDFIQKGLAEKEFTPEQQKAFRFFIARNVALQYVTGLYHGGEHFLSSHNEQYISFSSDGRRVGQFDPEIQSFGAIVSNHADTLDHLKTKVELMDQIGKSRPPHIAFLAKSLPESGPMSTDRNARAELRGKIQSLYQDLEVLEKVKAGELVLIPIILQEKTGQIKSIPNLAI